MPERFGEQFLHQQDPELHITQPVEHEKERLERKGEEISQKPAEKIADWLELLERTHTGHRDKPEVLERIKQSYHKQYVIKSENIPENYWDLQRRIIVSEGRGGDFEKNEEGKILIPDEVKQQAEQVLISDQEKSLDKWVDYLTSPDADVYPTWAKYWAFISMVKMGKLEKKEDENGNETARFQKRTKDTVSSFPPLNAAALAMTISAIEEKAREKQKPKLKRGNIENKSIKLNDKEFQSLLSTENFSKIYSQFLIEMPEYSTEGLKNIKGEWVKFTQGSSEATIVKSLEGHPLEWCIRNPDTAKSYLQGGDFHLFYSYAKDDEPDNPTVPRIAIRMEGQDKIAEVRGIAADQNFDPYIAPVLDKKLKEFGQEGERYQKASADMKKLTAISEKMEKDQKLAKDDLIFLYEIDGRIDGFGYQKDPRIKEVLSKRNLQEDLPIIFECQSSQIALSKEQITKDTITYIGEWTPEILNLMPENVKYIYEKFPDKKVFWRTIETNSNIKNAKDAEDILEQQRFKIYDYAKEMLKKTIFSGEKQKYKVVSFSVESLGFSNGAKYKDIIAKAKEFGLELCPAELGPQLRLQYKDQPNNEYLRVGMEPIVGSGGCLRVFRLFRDGSELWLGSGDGDPGDVWDADDRFVFVRPRK